jgi:diguanylate cyclase (GGDEF)-like protein/PAS domain S-box-containing protein
MTPNSHSFKFGAIVAEEKRSMNINRRSKTNQHLLTENVELRARLTESEEILRAIRCGEVDAFFNADAIGERVIALKDAESAYRVLVEVMNEGAGILINGRSFLYCNGRFAKMLKAPLKTVMGASIFRFIAPADQKTVEMLLDQGQTKPCAGKITFCCECGTAVPAQLSLSPMQIHGEKAICVVATDLTDLIERNRAEEELRTASMVDELTGLLNRRGFLTVAQQQLKLAHRMKGKLFLAFADLDGMKSINDNLGHLEGDHALSDTADILKKAFRDSDTIARFGGDEFAVLAMGTIEIKIASLVKRLHGVVDAHNARGHRPYQLSMSVGIVRYDPEIPMPIGSLLERADAAMYEQKRHKFKNATRRCLDEQSSPANDSTSIRIKELTADSHAN